MKMLWFLVVIIVQVRLVSAWSWRVLEYECENDCCAENEECVTWFPATHESCIATSPSNCTIKTKKQITLDYYDAMIASGDGQSDVDHWGAGGVNTILLLNITGFRDWSGNRMEYASNYSISAIMDQACLKLENSVALYFPYEEKSFPSTVMTTPKVPQETAVTFPISCILEDRVQIPLPNALAAGEFRKKPQIALVVLRDFAIYNNEETWPSWRRLRRQLQSTNVQNWRACSWSWGPQGVYGRFQIWEWISGTLDATSTTTTTSKTYKLVAGNDLDQEVVSDRINLTIDPMGTLIPAALLIALFY